MEAHDSSLVMPGRDPSFAAVRAQLEGRTVLVTGAGGILGAELCRQIAAHHPARLILLDHDDRRLALTHLSLGGSLTDYDDLLLVDTRDLSSVSALLLPVAPDVVFHTASLRDPELLERHPREAWLTNVVGTRNMLQAATDAGVGTFVTITRPGPDGPATVLRRTAVEAERLTMSYAETHLGRYVAVRLAARAVSTLPVEEGARLVLAAAAAGTDGGVVDADQSTAVVA